MRATLRPWACWLCVAGMAVAWRAGATDVECAASNTAVAPAYRQHVEAMDHRLGVADDYAEFHHLELMPQAARLVDAGKDIQGRTVRLAPSAATALREMMLAAESEGVTLQIVSGYRSAEYQAELLRQKMHRGMPLESALRINTPPGYSEHQTGCAVDLTTPGAAATESSFADTAAYRWLQRHGPEYGFRLSYPSGNPNGIEFEPWHWRYAATTPTASFPRKPIP
ncbi:MAG TPA: M15 family metallopeptidase [Rhodanobacteraceae bacterium]|nr:M15 family metallopeptidase [Rhodanobacteraceae bacterium]